MLRRTMNAERPDTVSLVEVYWRALTYLAVARGRSRSSCLTMSSSRSSPLPSRSSRPHHRLDLGKTDVTPALAMWAGLGVFNIIAFVLVSRGADRLAHAVRGDVLARSYEKVITMPLAWHPKRGTSNSLHTLLRAVEALFSLWLEFMRQHLSTAVALVLLVPTAISLDLRMSMVLFTLGIAYVIDQPPGHEEDQGRAGRGRAALSQGLRPCQRLGRQRLGAAELWPHPAGDAGAEGAYRPPDRRPVSGPRLVGAGQRAATPVLDHLDDGRAASSARCSSRAANCASATWLPSPASPRC